MALTKGAYTHELTDTTRFITTPANEMAARKQFQDMFDDILRIVNNLITELGRTSSSGATLSATENIGGKAVDTIPAGTLYSQMAAILAIAKAAKEGQLYENAIDDISYITDGLITNAKLATDIKIGSLADLSTTVKTSVQEAINELVIKTGGLTSLSTDDKTSIVNAINELVNKRALVDGEVAAVKLGADVPRILLPGTSEDGSGDATGLAAGTLYGWYT